MDKALKIQQEVIKILGTDEVYLVGGSVRDIVLGQEPKDFDFTTPLLPDDIEARAEAAGRHVYAIGKKFGTIGFKVEVEPRVFEYVEVTTFRSEVYTSKSRKPEVAFVASLEEDLARRDFTFNAMVLRPDGTIYDPYGGRIDILAKQINTVGLPKDRIQEDPLRMLRAARFAARYGFKIDPNFIGKARQLRERIYDVSIERWVQELDKLLTSQYYGTGLAELGNMGLTECIFPEAIGSGVETMPNKDPDMMWKQLLSKTGPTPRMTRYINGGICQRLKFSNKRTDIIVGKKLVK